MTQTQLGLKQNWQQFTLLVVINAFVGAMVGLERAVLPLTAEASFGIAAKTAILSFIVVFGISKAITNYYTGAFANRIGRRNLLIIGWLIALPIPILLIYAPSWNWVVFANILLGINQGLCWSSTVVMKIDLVGEKNRGLAMGLNESAGYLAVGSVALLTAFIAQSYQDVTLSYYLGIAFAAAGLVLSAFFVKDTMHHVKLESVKSGAAKLKNVFWETTWKNPNLGSISQAGLVNNLNDGMVWGLLPLLLAQKYFDLKAIGIIVSIYPAVWGVGQLFTGKLADHWSKKKLMVWGMLLQAAALFGIAWTSSYTALVACSTLLGLGTAMVYPTFLASIADHTHPQQRAKSIGVFRLWRDLGYAFGALFTGIIADIWDIELAILCIAGLTLLSGMILQFRSKE